MLALPIFAAIGAAIDTGAVYSAHKQLQNLVDSAAIAGASKLGVKDDQRIETAEAFIKSNSAQLSFPITNKSVTVSDGIVKVIARHDYPTAIMNLFGINTIPVTTTSAVQAGAQGTDTFAS